MITAKDLLDRVMNAPLACYSKQELWHRYLADIGPGDECLEFGVASGRSITCMAEMRASVFIGRGSTWNAIRAGFQARYHELPAQFALDSSKPHPTPATPTATTPRTRYA